MFKSTNSRKIGKAKKAEPQSKVTTIKRIDRYNKTGLPSYFRSTLIIGILIVIIMLEIAWAGSWQVTLSSGEKFRRIEQLYLNETTLYLVSYGIAPNELPIPVYVGDIKSIKRIRHNRFLGLSCGGYLGWLFGEYLFIEWTKSNNQQKYSVENAAELGMLSGFILGRLVCVSKTRLLHMTVEERKLIINEILFLDSLPKLSQNEN